MSVPVSIITPSYVRDFESCRLLCETIDAYVTGYDLHYIVVPDADHALFATLSGSRRRIVAEGAVLPRWLMQLPGSWKGRRYYWMAGTRPVYGWHTQQLRKFAMSLAQPSPRVMFMDSDNLFVRPFDLARYAGGETAPMYVDRGAIGTADARHVAWLRTAHRLLGLAEPALPADDYIGPMVVWDVDAARQALQRIEDTTGTDWCTALLRRHSFSEYLIYGAAVSATPSLRARHHLTTERPCLTYWEGPALDTPELMRFAGGLKPEQSALTIQSFTRTPIETLRAFAFRQSALA
jgi:hypothetical protein